MKRSRFLLIFVFVAAVALLATSPQVRAGNESPEGFAGIITFQYAMDDGTDGSGVLTLDDDGTFVDGCGTTGYWAFYPTESRYNIQYPAGDGCRAVLVGIYYPANQQILGGRACTRGNHARGTWLGLYSNALPSESTSRVSMSLGCTQGNGDSDRPAISENGQYVAFRSSATTLVSNDTNLATDIFVRDWRMWQISRVSVASDGTQANGSSYSPAISADGQSIAFSSAANNLVNGDSNGRYDVFVHDRATGQTSLVSIASDGTQGNYDSGSASISADRRYVAFESYATNLVSGDTNGEWDIFVHDRQTGQTSRVSVASDGTQGNGGSYAPAISGDGRFVVFYSWATNLVANDTNAYPDVFVHDRQTGETTRVSVASDGTEGNDRVFYPSISVTGQVVAFGSYASNLVSDDTNNALDIFVHDRQTGQTSRVSVATGGGQGNAGSYEPALSPDGRYVAFQSSATNLISDDTNGKDDVFVYDRLAVETIRVSVAHNGAQGNYKSGDPTMSAGGEYVAFYSYANNLVSNDTNDFVDVFVRDWSPVPPTDDPPVAMDDAANTPEDTPVAIAVLANDSDPDGDFLIVVAVTQPEHGNVVSNGSQITYSPLLNYNGEDAFTYTVSDGLLTDVATVTVSVSPVNDPPVAVDDFYLLILPDEDLDVLSNDDDPELIASQTLIITEVTQPPCGTVTIVGDGHLIHYDGVGCSSWPNSFNYTVCDNGIPQLCDEAEVVVDSPMH